MERREEVFNLFPITLIFFTIHIFDLAAANTLTNSLVFKYTDFWKFMKLTEIEQYWSRVYFYSFMTVRYVVVIVIYISVMDKKTCQPILSVLLK